MVRKQTFNTDGMLKVDSGAHGLEPFLLIGNRDANIQLLLRCEDADIYGAKISITLLGVGG